MITLLLAAVLSTDTDIENYLKSIPAETAENTRFLEMPAEYSEKEKESCAKVISFVLNTISDKKAITKPVFLNENVLRFDLRDYGILPKNYETLPKDPYRKANEIVDKLTKSKRSIIRTDFFIIKTMTAPTYYKLINVSKLSEFRERYGHDPQASKKAKTEQAAVVVISGVSRNTRYIKRSVTLNGSIWESRESASVDYLQDLTSDKYDNIELLAFNANGLLSYYVADKKGRAADMVSPEIAVDHQKNFEPDLVVRVARNCIACHSAGIVPVEDKVRKLLEKNIKLIATDNDAKDRLTELFSTELPISKDQDIYKEAVLKATGLEPKELNRKFIHVWKSYYEDLTIERAAKEMGLTVEEFKKQYEGTKDVRIISLIALGKINRVYFEKVLEEK